MSDRSSIHPAFAAAKNLPVLKIRSEAHKRAFCRMLLDTHDPYPAPSLAILNRFTRLNNRSTVFINGPA
jgi:hypothetical protein